MGGGAPPGGGGVLQPSNCSYWTTIPGGMGKSRYFRISKRFVTRCVCMRCRSSCTVKYQYITGHFHCPRLHHAFFPDGGETFSGSSGPAQCWPCPPGTYNPAPYLQGLQNCSQCPPGLYCERPGLGQPSGNCSAGYYCTGGANTSTPVSPRGTACWMFVFISVASSNILWFGIFFEIKKPESSLMPNPTRPRKGYLSIFPRFVPTAWMQQGIYLVEGRLHVWGDLLGAA